MLTVIKETNETKKQLRETATINAHVDKGRLRDTRNCSLNDNDDYI